MQFWSLHCRKGVITLANVQRRFTRDRALKFEEILGLFALEWRRLGVEEGCGGELEKYIKVGGGRDGEDFLLGWRCSRQENVGLR